MSLDAARRGAIEAAAAAFSRDGGPVDPFMAAAERGVEVVASTALTASGVYVEDGADAVIVYATRGRTREFQRFSVAHELGHHVLHRGRRFPPAVMEREADFFAGCMLMQRAAVASAWREGRGDPIDAAERLAVRCAVSITAASIRLVEVVGTAMVAVVVSEGVVRQWRTNAAVAGCEGSMRRLAGGPPPPGALVHRLAGDVSRMSIPAQDGVWFRRGARGFTEHARALGERGRNVTVLARAASDFDGRFDTPACRIENCKGPTR